MRIFFTFWQALGAWFGRAVPETGPIQDDAQRRSVRDVTLEQLGVTHWSCHSHF